MAPDVRPHKVNPAVPTPLCKCVLFIVAEPSEHVLLTSAFLQC